jgi:hypothetical protein
MSERERHKVKLSVLHDTSMSEAIHACIRCDDVCVYIYIYIICIFKFSFMNHSTGITQTLVPARILQTHPTSKTQPCFALFHVATTIDQWTGRITGSAGPSGK